MYYEAMTKRKVFGGTGWNTHEGFEEAQRRFSNCFVNRGMRVKKIDLYHTEEL
ncbi:hypothetical protein [Thermoactinomyces sp. DSM 45892]|uniref:hypothetical protein n=1 Tax=Thermoactinomyces sp. DSM 45892 TaxID=1882753 RepID=UPI0015A32750|nr:hypothetical protein [Thermoactinomyces sp. DSM 45892]